MKNCAVCVGVFAFGRNRDVIYIVARLKISGNSGVGFSVGATRQKWFVGGRAFENDDVGRNRRIQVSLIEKLAKGFAELFELGGNFANIFFRSVSD